MTETPVSALRSGGLRPLLGLWLLAWPALAVSESLLPPCPDRPSCVSTLDEEMDIPALRAGPSRQQALQRVEEALEAMPRTSWQKREEHRIEAEFRSLIFRFVDDVIFHVHEDGRVDVRSASRIGYWDFGANRRRVENLRERIEEGEIAQTD